MEAKSGEIYSREEIQHDTSLPVGDVWSIHELCKDAGLAGVLQKVLDKKDAGMVLAIIYDRVEYRQNLTAREPSMELMG